MNRVATRWFTSGTLACLLLAMTATAWAQGSTFLTHNPVTQAVAGKPIEIRAESEGESGSNIREADVFFRTTGFSSWTSLPMNVDYSTISGKIPGEYVTAEGVEYFIQAVLQTGEEISFPPYSPEEGPLLVNVSSGGGEEAEVESGIFIVSPAADRMYEEPNVLITASFNPAVYKVNPKQVVIRFDGRNITGRAIVNEYLANVIVENVRDGRHRIDILEKKQGGRMVLLRSWTFEYRSPFDESGKIAYRLTGSVGVDGRAQQYNGYQQSILRETVNVRYEKGGFRSQLYARMTSEENARIQPQHRFRLTAGWDFLQLGLGDLNPRYSELILYGQRVRGAELRAKYGWINAQALYGQLRRSVTGDGYQLSSIDSVLVNANNATYEKYNTYTLDPGTFTRNMSALRLGIGKPSTAQWGLTVLKVRDDTSSTDLSRPGDLGVGFNGGAVPVDVDYLRTPRDNLVVGSDFKMNFDRRRITFSAEAAVSLYNSDISVRPLEDAESISNIIVINQFFEPLPDNFGGEEGGDNELKQSDLVAALLNNALSWQTKLRLRYYGHDLRTGYKYVNRSYITLGNPALPNDEAGFFIYDRVRLFDSRLYLNGGYRIFHNNVRNRSDRTLWRNEVSFGFGYYTPPGLPDFTMSYRQQGNKNNGELEQIIVDQSAGTTYELDDRLSNATGTWVLGMNQTADVYDTRNTASVSLTTSSRADEYQEFGDSNMLMGAFSLRTDLSNYLPVSTQLLFSRTSQSAMEDRTQLNYTNLSGRVNVFLLNRKLVPFFNPKLTLGTGEYSLSFLDELPDGVDPATTPVQQNIDFTRIDWIAGFEYRFLGHHTVTGRASISEYQDRGGITYFDGSVGPNTSTVDRDDYALSFGYIYKF